MSRTYKDKPSRLKYDQYDKDMVVFSREEITKTHHHEYINGEIVQVDWPESEWLRYTHVTYIFTKSTKPYKRRTTNDKWYWYKRTPSWWSRMMMNRPQRRQGRMWERKVLLEDLEATDPPGVSRKPHIYYY